MQGQNKRGDKFDEDDWKKYEKSLKTNRFIQRSRYKTPSFFLMVIITIIMYLLIT